MPDVIDVVIANPDISVEPGGAVEVEVLLRNQGGSADSAALEVEFSEPGWIALPVSGLAIEAGQSRSVRIVFRAPRASAAPTGSYPFVVRTRSLETGATAAAQGALHVRPSHSFHLEVAPGRSHSSPLHPQAEYQVQLENRGNAPDTYDLTVHDPEGACVYRLPAERVEVSPGETVQIPLTVEPRRRPAVASPQLFGFQVKALPLSAAVPAESSHGQLEYRGICSPFAAFLVALALVYGCWYLWDRQHGPEVSAFEARPSTVVAGQPVTLVWGVSRASRLTLQNNNINERYSLDPNSTTRVVDPNQTTSYTLIAEDNAERSARKTLTVAVTPNTPPPPPAIYSFRANPGIINQGSSVVLQWKVSGAQALFLEPSDKQLDPALSSFEDTPRQTTTYALVAKNKDGVTARRALTVAVILPPDPNLPRITFFAVTPTKVRAGEPVTVSWNVTGASSVIMPGIGLVESQGSRTFQPQRSSQFGLMAVGPSGLQAQKSVNVEVVSAPHITTFSAHPDTIKPGEAVELTWSVQHTESVGIDGIGPVNPEGSLEVKPDKTTTYTLKAADASGQDTEQTVTVTVGASP